MFALLLSFYFFTLLPLLLVSKYGITILASANTPCVDHVTHEDTAIAHFACVCHLEDHLHRGLHQGITTDDCQGYALNHVRRILYTTIDSLFAALTDAVNAVVLKPVNVRLQQCFFYILELFIRFLLFTLLIINTTIKSFTRRCNLFAGTSEVQGERRIELARILPSRSLHSHL